jgi:hypothetical protein
MKADVGWRGREETRGGEETHTFIFSKSQCAFPNKAAADPEISNEERQE